MVVRPTSPVLRAHLPVWGARGGEPPDRDDLEADVMWKWAWRLAPIVAPWVLRRMRRNRRRQEQRQAMT